MSPPDFSKLTPPHDVAIQCAELLPAHAIVAAYRAGAQYGWNEARQLWPTPIADRPPTEADGDRYEDVQVVSGAGRWKLCHWSNVNGDPWLHTPTWRPPAPKPTLKEQALACLDELAKGEPGYWKGIDTIRRALEGGEVEG